MAEKDPPITVPEFGKMLCYDGAGGFLPGVIVFGVMGVLMFIGGVSEIHGPKLFMAIGLLFFGILFTGVAALLVFTGPTATWFYEHGVIQKTRNRVRPFAYKDAQQAAYGVWMQRTKYGLQTTMNLGLRPGDGSPDLKFTTLITQAQKTKPGKLSEEQVHKLGHMLCTMVARQIVAELNGGRSVAWTKDVQLDPKGLSLRTDGTFVAWNQIVSADINEKNGYIEVRIANEKKPVVKMSNSDMNARPGMYVIQSRIGRKS